MHACEQAGLQLTITTFWARSLALISTVLMLHSTFGLFDLSPPLPPKYLQSIDQQRWLSLLFFTLTLVKRLCVSTVLPNWQLAVSGLSIVSRRLVRCFVCQLTTRTLTSPTAAFGQAPHTLLPSFIEPKSPNIIVRQIIRFLFFWYYLAYQQSLNTSHSTVLTWT